MRPESCSDLDFGDFDLLSLMCCAIGHERPTWRTILHSDCAVSANTVELELWAEISGLHSLRDCGCWRPNLVLESGSRPATVVDALRHACARSDGILHKALSKRGLTYFAESLKKQRQICKAAGHYRYYDELQMMALREIKIELSSQLQSVIWILAPKVDKHQVWSTFCLLYIFLSFGF